MKMKTQYSNFNCAIVATIVNEVSVGTDVLLSQSDLTLKRKKTKYKNLFV